MVCRALGVYYSLGNIIVFVGVLGTMVKRYTDAVLTNMPFDPIFKKDYTMPYTYDDQNIFAKILRGEIPNDTVMETDHTLAFNDIQPQAPIHILIIPKGGYVTADHFALAASDAEIVDFTRVTGQICANFGVQPATGGQGYRIISNAGNFAAQEVPHYHVHLVAGRFLGPILHQPQ